MKVSDIVNLIMTDGGSWLVVFLLITSLIQISPIKLNPWTALINWIGKNLNKSVLDEVKAVDKKVDEVEAQVKNVQSELNDHIKDSKNKDLAHTRSEILSFGSSLLAGRNYHKEQFDFMINRCDEYEQYCKENKVMNGVADATIKEIRRIYSVRLAENSFLKGEKDNEEAV